MVEWDRMGRRVRYVSAGDGGIGTRSMLQGASQRLWSYSLKRNNAMLCEKNDNCEKGRSRDFKRQRVSARKEDGQMPVRELIYTRV